MEYSTNGSFPVLRNTWATISGSKNILWQRFLSLSSSGGLNA